MDGVKFEFNDIESLYTKINSEWRRFVSLCNLSKIFLNKFIWLKKINHNKCIFIFLISLIQYNKKKIKKNIVFPSYKKIYNFNNKNGKNVIRLTISTLI